MSLSYNAGDIIMDNCVAFVKVLYNHYKDSHCKNCFAETAGLKYCSGCGIFKYCGKKCQTEDWKNGHKLECKSKCFRQYCLTGINIDIKVFLFRGVALLKLNPDLGTKPYTLHDGTTRCFNDLMSHQESVAKDRAMQWECENMAKHINEEDPGNKVEVDYLHRMLGIYQTNAFCITDEEESCSLGSGIYVEASVFNHSCKPNAFFRNKGINLQIRAIGPVPMGEQPHISYITNHLDRTQRRKLLQERYNFECHCEKCESGSDSGIDYDKLNSLVLIIKMKQAMPFGGQWQLILTQHGEIIKMFRQIYNEYDERVTNQFNRALTICLKLGADKRKIKELFESTRLHLLTTFGDDHFDYKHFQNYVAPCFA